MSVDALPESLKALVNNAKVLLVGAGGIGCEVLKNLVLTGFKSIEVIDLDTIDVSNLNRQFLFQRPHVGQSKSRVACSAAQQFCPDVRLVAHHDSVIKPEYGVSFFKEFTVVLNALDNRAARSHVNRMCLAADVPLVESGTAGYLGQVTVIKKGATECYDCQPKSAQKTYPGCTIRNTPSEPIHCIVWAKHLFNQLFGEADPDEDVSPDTADPELAGDAAGANALLASESAVSGDGNVQRQSTRAWAAQHGYRVDKLFRKLFHDDIKYLLSMDKLWLKRTPPKPLDYEELTTITLDSPTDIEDGSAESGSGSGLADQRVWSASECCSVLNRAVQQLRQRVGSCDQQPTAAAGEEKREEVHLTWDKDDAASMDFVAACANLRSYCFGIPLNSRFTVKSMAGNIIPAIATTNAIIAGLLVMETFKLLQDRLQDCRTVYLNRKPNLRNCLLVHCSLMKPNPKCYVCADKPEVTVRLDVDACTIQTLEDRVLKAALHMAAPDAELEDGRGTILISSEPGETDANRSKTLAQLGVRHGMRLKCDDFLQNYELVVNIVHSADMEPGTEFELIGDASQLTAPSSSDGPQQSTSGQSSTSGVLSAPVHTNGASSHSSESSDAAATNSSANASNGQSVVEAVEDDDDLVCLSDDKLVVEPVEAGGLAPVAVSKRPHDDDSSDLLAPAAKRSRAVLPATSSSPSSPQPEVIDL